MGSSDILGSSSRTKISCVPEHPNNGLTSFEVNWVIYNRWERTRKFSFSKLPQYGCLRQPMTCVIQVADFDAKFFHQIINPTFLVFSNLILNFLQSKLLEPFNSPIFTALVARRIFFSHCAPKCFQPLSPLISPV